jgi:hypothetical protein
MQQHMQVNRQGELCHHFMTLECNMNVPPTGMGSLQPSLAQDVEFVREICWILVGLYRGVAFQ